MGPIFRFLNYLLNRCPSCGVSSLTVCTRCWHVLNDGVLGDGLFEGEADPFTQRFLYWWDDRLIEASSVLRELILSSKEYPAPELIQLWAHEFYRRGLIEGLFAARRNWVLIPPPGRSGRGEEDHAGALAQVLAAVSGGTLKCDLMALERVGESRRSKSRSSEKSQKTKSRAERSEIEFRVSEAMKARVSHVEGFIFIDDVIATGATAKAAWVALGRPQAFESWAIALKVNEATSLLSTYMTDGI